MATNTEKIDELYRLVTTLAARFDALDKDVQGVWPEIEKVSAVVGGIKTQTTALEEQVNFLKPVRDQVEAMSREVAVLKDQTKRLRDDLDKAGGRLWALVPRRRCCRRGRRGPHRFQAILSGVRIVTRSRASPQADAFRTASCA